MNLMGLSFLLFIPVCLNTLSSHWPTNSCHIWDICQVWDNITFNISSILQMLGSKFLLYLKSTTCQYLLSNKKSVFKIYSYKTCLLIKDCHIQDVLELQFLITIIDVHFHTLWMHVTVKTCFSKKLHTFTFLSIRPKRIEQTSYS